MNNNDNIYFRDRMDAGQKLADFLQFLPKTGPIVYSLTNGGVIVGAEIARRLNYPFDVIPVKKILNPLSNEQSIGAVSENGISVLNDNVLNVDPLWIAEETNRADEEVGRLSKLYFNGRKHISCSNKIALVCDDNMITGASMLAAIKQIKKHFHPEKIIVAVPVASKESVDLLHKQGYRVVSIVITNDLQSIDSYYQSFEKINDLEVLRNLRFFTSPESNYSESQAI